MSGVSEFLKEHVYPVLNAVECGLLDEFAPGSPTSGSNGTSYPMTCPRCEKKRAYYYVGSSTVQCNRIENCEPTSLWDIVSRTTTSNGDTFKALCELAGVEPPERDTDTPIQSLDIFKLFMRISQTALRSNAEEVKTFLDDKNFTIDQLLSMGLGFYPSARYFEVSLKNQGVTDFTPLYQADFLPDPTNKDTSDFKWAKRIIGAWRQPDGGIRLWSRKVSTNQPGSKYFFASGSSKEIPYLYRQRMEGDPILVEGTLDSWALRSASLFGCAIGGASINLDQAIFLSIQGHSEVTHVIDPDGAGYKGALTSIYNTEQVGVHCKIAIPDAFIGDLDDYRLKGQGQLIPNVIEDALPAGDFLALLYANAVFNGDKDMCDRVVRISCHLTAYSADRFKISCQQLGCSPEGVNDAITSFGNLIKLGVSSDSASRNIQRRFGVSIRVTGDTHE